MQKNRQNLNRTREKSNRILLFICTSFLLFNIQIFAQIQTDVPALKDVYANDFYIGCLLSYAHVGFSTDPYVPGQSAVVDTNGGHLIKFHMNSMSPGNWMKAVNTVDISGSASAYAAAATQQEKDSIDIHPKVRFQGNLIAQLNWAQRQGFTFRGHTLVWHSQTPGTAFFRSGYTAGGTRLTKERMTERMRNYIKEVIRLLHESWPGLLSAMDVVNEAVNGDGSDRSSNSEWYTTFGDNSYILKAFEFTRHYCEEFGEEQIKLYYNDYSTHVSAKADGIVRVCGPIFHAGLLDGIGMQDHDQNASPTAAQWIASYNKFDSICTEMSVTELDVNPGTVSETTLRTQANQYAQLFKCFTERSHRSGRGKIVSVSKDGLNDQWAFVANASLWTSQNQCKPAFFSVVFVGQNYNALDSLISFADTLEETKYTPESWSNFDQALVNARNSRDRNYSNTESAGDTLGKVKDELQSALNALVITGVEYESGNKINKYTLSQNYPNPFNPSTIIRYSIPKSGHISIKIFNIHGEEVAILFDGIQETGSYSVTFNAGGLANGVYLYQLRADGFTETKKLLLLK